MGGVTNPGTAKTITSYTVVYTQGSTTANHGSGTFSFTPEAASLGSNTAMASNSDVVAASATLTVTIEPTNAITAGGQVLINVPKWERAAAGATSPASFFTAGSVSCSSTAQSGATPTCTFVVNSDASGFDTMTVTGAFTAAQSA